MSISVGSPLLDYKLAVQSQDRLLAQFQKTPTYAKAVSYYRDNIGKVTSVDDLVNDRRLLEVALSAYGLEDEIDSKALVKKLLTEDPTDKNSVAYRLVDPRFRQFAAALGSLNTDGGKQIRSAATTATVLDRYTTNEFEKFLGESDEAVREALYFKRTVTDTIDVKNVSDLMDTFKNSPAITQAVQDYRNNVKNITSVNGLLKDDKTLAFALSAYGLDDLITDKATVQRLLTEDPASATSLAQTDPRYQSFAKSFSSLRYDGGASLQNSDSVDAVVTAYQNHEFEQSLSTTDADAKAEFATQYAAENAPQPSATYYRDNIGKVVDVEDLLNDDQLLGVALTAFDLGSLAGDKATVRRLLTEDPTGESALAQTDPRMMQFATEFGSLKTDGGAKIRSAADIDAVTSAFGEKQYGNSMSVTQAVTYYRDNIGNVLSPSDLLNDGELLYVALGAYGLGDLINDKTSVQKLLTQDPSASGSLAQTDPRYLAFAQGFASLKSDAGKQIQSEANIDAVVSAFAAQPFQSAPTPEQSAQYYFDNIGKVTSVNDLLKDGQLLHVALSAFGIGDLINDKDSVKRLLTEFTVNQNALANTDPRYMEFAQAFSSLQLGGSEQIQSDASLGTVLNNFLNKLTRDGSGSKLLTSYYRDSIGKITDVTGLLSDDQLLQVALSAYGLGDLINDKATVEQILTEDPTAPGALVQTNAKYAAFQTAFGSLNTDGGAKIHDTADIDGVVKSYDDSEFSRLFALVQPTTRTGLYGKDGEKTVGGLLAELQNSGSYQDAVSYFRANISKARNADGLLGDKTLLSVALSAYHIDGLAEQPDMVRRLLTEDPSSPGALAQTDPRYLQFAQAFAKLRSGTAIRDAATIDGILASYQSSEFEKSLDPKVKSAIAANGTTLTPTQLLADATLAKVTRGALYMPDQLAALDLDQQLAALKRAGLDTAKLQDPAELEKFVTRYLLKTGMDQAASQTDPILTLFQGSSGSSDATSSSGGLINLLA